MARPIKLTYKEKILLHLLRYVGMEERYQVVRDVTQAKISEAVGIQRKHLPRTLRKLKEKGLVQEKEAHVKGVKQIRRVYFLSWKGEVMASKLKEEILSTRITYLDGVEKIEGTVADVANLLGISYNLLDIIEAVDQDGTLDLEIIGKQKRKRKEENPTRPSSYEDKLCIYRETLEKAWLDGRITLNERVILEHLRKSLGISLKEHDRLEAETLEKIPMIHQERMEIYKKALRVALDDLEITDDEEHILESLRENLQIRMEEHEELMKDILRDNELRKDLREEE